MCRLCPHPDAPQSTNERKPPPYGSPCRLGLADALADDLRLPLLLDDPFVYADPARHRAALELLMRVARETQVVLFTCRPLPEGDWGKVITLGGV